MPDPASAPQAIHGMADRENLDRIVFILGISVEPFLKGLSHNSLIYVDSLQNESRLQDAGFQACYIYRDRQRSFDRAADLALKWLGTTDARIAAAGKNASALFGDHPLPAWKLSYDALFEIKGGIFDSILYRVLADDLCTPWSVPIQVYAVRPHPMAQAIALASRGIASVGWQEKGGNAFPPQKSRVGRLWERIDRLLVHRALLALRRPSRTGRVALVLSGGDMSRIREDGHGRPRISDVYYENLDTALDAAVPSVLRIAVNPPHLAESTWKNRWLVWRSILSGAFAPWYAYSTLSDIGSVMAARRRYRSVLQQGDKDENFRGFFRVDGLDFYPLIRGTLFERLPGLLSSAHFHFAIAHRIVARERVSLAISVEAFSNLGRCLSSALHRDGGQLWGIQGGIISPQRVTNAGFYVPALGEQRDDLMADRLLIWGSAYQSLLAHYGIPEDRLHLMGFNRTKILPPPSKGKTRKRILYVTGGNAEVCPYLMTTEEEQFTLQTLVKCIPPDSDLLIRAHPRHEPKDFHRWIGDHPHARVEAASERTIAECLADVDCVVGKASTVLLEAANAGRRVLLVNFGGTPDFTGFSREPHSLPCATDPESLKEWLGRLTSDDDEENSSRLDGFVRAWCPGDTREAASHLTAALKAMTREGS